jgi:hypothetical protein
VNKQAERNRWARDVGLDVSAKKGQWALSVALETTGELPKVALAPNEPSFVLELVPNGWWVVVSVPLDVGKTVKKWFYVSWKPAGERWKAVVETVGVAASHVPQEAGGVEIEPPTKLATIREWLTVVEQKLEIAFRRDRPLIESNVKGGAKAMAAWIKG